MPINDSNSMGLLCRLFYIKAQAYAMLTPLALMLTHLAENFWVNTCDYYGLCVRDVSKIESTRRLQLEVIRANTFICSLHAVLGEG